MIDRDVEKLVRKVLHGVVQSDSAKFEAALQEIPDSHISSAVSLALAIDRTVLSDFSQDSTSPERLEYLSSEFVKMEDWYNARDLPVKEFLSWIQGGVGPSPDSDVVGLLAFLVGGWLLSAFLEDDAEWYDYLDDILNRLDVA